MKITVHSSKAVKPAYDDGNNGSRSRESSSPFAKAEVVPLSVFDKATFDQHIPALYFFPAPAPPRAALEAGLARALGHYREWAGRRGADADGNPAILLTDAGARLVEATADAAIADAADDLLAPETLLSLHPSCCSKKKEEEELVVVQVTRFACGAFVVGVSSLHLVADGHAVFEFLAAWGQATRGVAVDPVPEHDRVAPFTPRVPPRVEFDHREAEFKVPRPAASNDVHDNHHHMDDDDEVVVSTVRFTREWVSNLKSHIGSSSSTTTISSRTSTLQCVLAHLWRCITVARGLSGHQTTTLRIAVNGRTRMRNPEVPAGYTGNVVLWARPTTTVRDLTTTPLASTVELIARAVAKIDDRYFRSFIDYASSGEVERAGLAPAADAAEAALSPDVEVDSLLGLPADRVDFGAGPPSLFVPGYLPVEGVVFVVPSFDGDGSVYAYVPLFRGAVDAFNECCYVLPDEPPHAALPTACADDLPRVMTATRMCGAPPPRV
ncbi:hypothetical protein PR202_ga22598 [Eleusine coracana subsp. coracana]|uniref:Uncharacterized protein n=1 Tax=Eleusine coracana subsp. coracana TaxID=191504 RepID=A0AAV5D4J6_ELECO|nr:hypothetical protein PR202_ga22598 [Eleusine coracana subsp. coracana]